MHFRLSLAPHLSSYPIVGVDGLRDALGLLRLLLLLFAVVLGGGAPAGGRGRLLLLLLLLQLGDLALCLGDLTVNLISIFHVNKIFYFTSLLTNKKITKVIVTF